MKTFKYFINEIKNSNNLNYSWSPPTPSKEHDEIEFQLNIHKEHPFLPDWVHKRLKHFENLKNFSNAISRGTPQKLSRKEYVKVNNTGDSWEDTKKWPKEDNGEKIKRVPNLFKDGNKIERPIILENPKTGERHLIAGHHRSTYCTDVLGHEVEAHIIH